MSSDRERAAFEAGAHYADDTRGTADHPSRAARIADAAICRYGLERERRPHPVVALEGGMSSWVEVEVPAALEVRLVRGRLLIRSTERLGGLVPTLGLTWQRVAAWLDRAAWAARDAALGVQKVD